MSDIRLCADLLVSTIQFAINRPCVCWPISRSDEDLGLVAWSISLEEGPVYFRDTYLLVRLVRSAATAAAPRPRNRNVPRCRRPLTAPSSTRSPAIPTSPPPHRYDGRFRRGAGTARAVLRRGERRTHRHHPVCLHALPAARRRARPALAVESLLHRSSVGRRAARGRAGRTSGARQACAAGRNCVHVEPRSVSACCRGIVVRTPCPSKRRAVERRGVACPAMTIRGASFTRLESDSNRNGDAAAFRGVPGDRKEGAFHRDLRRRHERHRQASEGRWRSRHRLG